MLGPTVYEAAILNDLSYMESDLKDEKVWRLIAHDSKLGLCHWESEEGYTYIGIAGTRRQKDDVVESVKVFFGKIPDDRIEGVTQYLMEHCVEAIANDSISLGGHSLGGLVASSVAAKFHLPALIQNSPGYFKTTPDPEKSNRIVEIKTARDVVSDWGSNAANLLTLYETSISVWKISILHALKRQNKLLFEQAPEIAKSFLKDVIHLPEIEKNMDVHPTGNTLSSILVSWKRLRNHCTNTAIKKKERLFANKVKW